MRIIKCGVKPEDKPMYGECSYCGTTIECTQGETEIQFDRNETLYHVVCPICEKQIWVSSKATA